MIFDTAENFFEPDDKIIELRALIRSVATPQDKSVSENQA